MYIYSICDWAALWSPFWLTSASRLIARPAVNCALCPRSGKVGGGSEFHKPNQFQFACATGGLLSIAAIQVLGYRVPNEEQLSRPCNPPTFSIRCSISFCCAKLEWKITKNIVNNKTIRERETCLVCTALHSANIWGIYSRSYTNNYTYTCLGTFIVYM